MKDKRREPRVGISFPVACDPLPQRHYFYTVCKDLSTEGVKIISNNFMPKGNSIKLNLNLIDKAINLKAKVMWCNKERYSDRYHAGLHFEEISEKDRGQIIYFLTSTKESGH